MNLQELTELVQQGEIAPGLLSKYQLMLAGWYSFHASELEAIEVSKPERWLKLRSAEGIKSDTQADREWDMTEDGKKEISLKWTLKRIEKLISSAKLRLRVIENEARNQY